MDAKLYISGLQLCIAEREHIPLRYAAMLALQVENDFDLRLIPAVKEWMEGTLTASFSVEDCSLQDIMNDTGASLLEALYMLNLQIKRPEQIDLCKWLFRGDDGCGSPCI